MKWFQANKNITKEVRRELAKSLNVNEEKIANWYYSMRLKKAAEGVLSLRK